MLYWQSLSSLVLTFAGNIRSFPKKEASERFSNWIGSGLALNDCKVYKDKRSSVLDLIVSIERNFFCNIDTW